MITADPDIRDEFGRAWRIEKSIAQTKHPSVVAFWLIEVPDAMPNWHSYGLLLTNHTPPVFQITLWALKPGQSRVEALNIAEIYPFDPAVYEARFTETEPGEAEWRTILAVRGLCAGLISPDGVQMVQWAALFGINRMDGEDDPEP